MKKMALFGFAVSALTACTGGGGGGGGGGGDSLPDPTADIAGYNSDCDGIEDSTGTFQEVEGATRYFSGVFDFIDDGVEGELSVSGTETLHIFANQAWLESGDENAMDCTITWNVFGTRTAGESTFSVAASARIDEGATTCTSQFASEAYEESQELEYTVTVNTTTDPWTSYWAFPSGTEFAEGTASEDGATYLSSAGCQFY